MCALAGSVACPRFGPLYLPLRSEARLNATATVLVRLDAVDAGSHEVQLVGYAALNVFMLRGSGAQPTGARARFWAAFARR